MNGKGSGSENFTWRFLICDIGGKARGRVRRAAGSDEGGVKYVLQDWQGSTRALVGNTGNVQSRSDYTAFGEQISSDTGLRTAEQGFGKPDALRQKYGLTERDDATGLDHTWFRKHENQAGRWTAPDPYLGSMSPSDPQSFNRYSYVQNDPVNWVDPSGLFRLAERPMQIPGWLLCYVLGICGNPTTQSQPGEEFPGGGGGGSSPTTPNESCEETISLPSATTDTGALAGLIFQESTEFSSFVRAFPPTSSGLANATNNFLTEMYTIGSIVINHRDLSINRTDLTTGFSGPNATIRDVIHSEGASGTQFAGFTPGGRVSSRITNRVNNALRGSSGSSDCAKLTSALLMARTLANGALTPEPGVFGMRTAGSGSPGSNFTLLDRIVGSGNDFYGLSSTFLNPR